MAYSISLVAGSGSIILWIILNFFNPYTAVFALRPMLTTIVTLLVPGILVIAASVKKRYKFFLIAFIWSFPISLYVTLTPGIFSLFGLTNILYLISFILAYIANRNRAKTK